MLDATDLPIGRRSTTETIGTIPRYRTTSNIVLARRRANIRTSELDVLRLLFLMKAIGILVRCGILVWREGDDEKDIRIDILRLLFFGRVRI